MIVLIAPETDIPNEIELLTKLFEEGLDYYHLRKPQKNKEEFCMFLNQIDSKYHSQIIVHTFHELINDYNLKGIHFEEQKRIEHIDNPGQYFKGLNMFGKTISSSFHEPKDLEDCGFEFDYHLLSPVFSSISKQGYKGREFNVKHIDKVIIGMGGITKDNLNEIENLGFNGVGVLGGVWNNENPIAVFKKMKLYYNPIIGNK